MLYSRLFRIAAMLCLIAVLSIPLCAQVGQNGTVSGFVLAADSSPLAGASVIRSVRSLNQCPMAFHSGSPIVVQLFRQIESLL
jgi:hypothetical protein